MLQKYQGRRSVLKVKVFPYSLSDTVSLGAHVTMFIKAHLKSFYLLAVRAV